MRFENVLDVGRQKIGEGHDHEWRAEAGLGLGKLMQPPRFADRVGPVPFRLDMDEADDRNGSSIGEVV